MAPAIIMNATQFRVLFEQKGTNSKCELNPWELCAFKWTDVSVPSESKLQSWGGDV